MAFQALIQLSQALSQPPQAFNWLSQALHQPSLTSYKAIQGPQSVLFSPSTNLGRTKEGSPVFYRTLSPLGPLPYFLSLKFSIKQSRAMGIADHILLLGDWIITAPAHPHGTQLAVYPAMFL